MKNMHLTTIFAFTTLALFGAMGHAKANGCLSSPIRSVSTQASEVALTSKSIEINNIQM